MDAPRDVTVPGETAEWEQRPDSACSVFGDRIAVADRYAEHLATTGVERGLLGPRELPRLWTRHILNCAVLSELLAPEVSLIDVGSGAGLPGLAVAIARPDLTVTLVEPFERRAAWLSEVTADLGVDVRVVRARAEDLAGREQAQVVTARAVAPLERLARWGLPLVLPHGELLAIKGRTAQAEVDESLTKLRRLGAQEVEVATCGDGVLDPATTVVRVRVGAGRPIPSAGGRSAGSTGRRQRREQRRSSR